MQKPMPTGTFKTTATVMPPELATRFKIAPELLSDERELFITDILKTMDDEE